MRSFLDLSSWAGLLTTLLGLVLVTLVAVGIRLLFMQTIQRRHEREQTPCDEGEVAASVFDRYRDPLYKQASFKPYIIAAMIFLAKVKDPAAKLLELEAKATLRHND